MFLGLFTKRKISIQLQKDWKKKPQELKRRAIKKCTQHFYDDSDDDNDDNDDN